MVVILAATLVAAAARADTGAASGRCRRVDAGFRDGRIFVRYPVAQGRLTMFTDTGGGGSLLTREAAARLGLTVHAPPAAVAAELGPDAAVAEPPPPAARHVRPIPPPLLIVPSAIPVPGWPERIDGMLGQSWFAGGRWTFDYRRGALLLGCRMRGRRLALQLPPPGAPGKRQFPRVEVRVAGEVIPMLLDTGATTWLTDAALAALGDGRGAVRATSMIAASRLASWRRQHPSWRIVENAQRVTGARMIEVPEVAIAGLSVGPVWFTERPDANFTQALSSLMAGPVEGAIGGNAFAGTRLTIDYRTQEARIER
jgi:hypothetical protein